MDPKLVEDAPLAVQAQAPVSAPGLFPFDKYSSAYLLFDASGKISRSIGGATSMRGGA